jgi:hypothetical protein
VWLYFRVLSICSKKRSTDNQNEVLATSQFGLAKALVAQKRDRVRAVELARSAEMLLKPLHYQSATQAVQEISSFLQTQTAH